MQIRDANIVVTGASTGIGRATALQLAGRGARVTAVARDEERLRSLAGEHGDITSFRADLTREEERAALAEQAVDVDVLVNNAGLGWKGLVEDMPPASVRELFELNVLALIDLTRRVLPGMLARQRGHVVNIGSIAGYVPVPGETVYCATKFAVLGFTDGLRRELHGRGVQVSLIAPGPIKTEFLARATTGAPAAQPGALDYGMPAESVARAVHRALRRRLPGYRTITVPRIGGWSRLATVPGIAHGTDLATRGRVRKALAER
jgi:short-subunit dehydrogenase